MKFKVDENLPTEAAALLTQRLGDALTVNDQRMQGSADPTLAQVCRDENRTLVTLDLDFADIRSYTPAKHAGIIVLRPLTQSKRDVLRLLERVVEQIGRERVAGTLWVVDEAGIRIRE
jgi:predicted nuclease of predicted toxin-antitoxin system